MKWFTLLLLAGCNQIYDLEGTSPRPPPDGPPDAPPLPDKDIDGVPDERDNCLDTPNPNQHDEDRDTHGDACDNCPQTPNAGQEDFDSDLVGDDCDPHPTDDVSLDCLVLFDSFLDPMAFASHWTTNVAVTPSPDLVELSGATFVSKELEDQVFDVQVVGTVGFNLPNGSVTVLSNGNVVDPPQTCILVARTPSSTKALAEIGLQNNPNPLMDEQPLSSAPVGKRFVLRLRVENQNPTVTCRVDYGLAVGVANAIGPNTPLNTMGAPGVRVSRSFAQIEAIAIYSHPVPTTACPVPVIR